VETAELFRRHGVSEKEAVNISGAFELTNGHPMWINMIAMQVVRMQRPLGEVLDRIRRGQGTLPEKTLRSIWASLNEAQRILLRTIAELERPETENHLQEMCTSLAWGKFTKSLKTLRALHLVVIKVRQSEPELIELHPLVRTFIRKEFPRQDRDRFISSIVRFLDKMIGRYKPLLGKKPSMAIMDHWAQKAELDINRGNHKDAIATLIEVTHALITSGFAEEMVRISKRLFDDLDWAEACSSYKGFDWFMRRALESMTQLGQFSEAEIYLGRYQNAIPGKSAQFINLCDLRCYLYWFQERFDAAIHWGEQGEALAIPSNVDTAYSVDHNLALARRDSGKVEVAFQYFLSGVSLEEVLREGTLDKERTGSFYGNIGRCLYFMGRHNEALIAYKKSAVLLENEDLGSESSILNRGYVRLWIGQALRLAEEKPLAAAFFKAAVQEWEVLSPPKARIAQEALDSLESSLSLAERGTVIGLTNPESIVRNWIRGGMSR